MATNKNAASDHQLGELHSKIATVIKNALDVADKAQVAYLESDVDLNLPPPQISAPLLSVAVKFLADNAITCNVEDSADLSDLEKTLAEKRERKRQKVGNVLPFAVGE